MTQAPDTIQAVKDALVRAHLTTPGRSPSGEPFITSNAVCLCEGAGGLVMVYLLSHPGMSGRGRDAWEMKSLRKAVEAALTGIENVEIQKRPMGRMVANAA